MNYIYRSIKIKMESANLTTLAVILLYKRRCNRRGTKKRRWGVRPALRDRRNKGEFKTCFLKYKLIDHEWFFMYTRMTPTQFDNLLNIVGPLLEKSSNREPLNPAQRLAMTLR